VTPNGGDTSNCCRKAATVDEEEEKWCLCKISEGEVCFMTNVEAGKRRGVLEQMRRGRY